MPQIINKVSTVSGHVPTSSDLTAGEIAVNTADKKLFVKKDDGTVVCVNNLTHLDGGVVVAPAPTTDQYFSDVVLLLQDSLSDNSLQGQTIAATGNAAPSTTQSKFGGVSFLTNGISNSLTVANDPAFAMPADFTIESWIYFDTYSASEGFTIWEPVNHSLGTFNSNRFQFLVYQDTLYTDVYGYVLAQSSPLGFTAGQWYHVAASRQGSTLRLFLNGTQVASPTTTRSFVADEYRLPQSRSTAREMYFDDLRVTVGTARYTTNFTPPTTAFPTTPNADPDFSDVVLLLQDSLSDESLQGQTLIVSGNTAATTVEAKFGSSISFDGSGDWITASPDPSLVFGTSPFTVEFWMYWDGTVTGTPWMGVMGMHNANGTGRYGIFMNASGIGHYIQSQFPAVSAVSANQWVHIASTRDSSGTCRFFIDGTLKTTVTDTGNLTAPEGFRVGNDFSGNRPPFSGYLDEIRVTKGVARYTSNFTPATTAFPATNGDSYFSNVSLLLQDSLTDESLQGQTVVATGAAAVSTAEVKVGTHSFAVPSVNDYLEIAGDPSLDFGTGDFTVECWLHMTGGNANQRNFLDFRGRNGPTISGRLVIYRSTTGLNVWDGMDRILGNAAVPDNQWLHIACTRKSGHLRLFLNGVLYGEYANHTTSLVCDSIVLGGTNSTLAMTGYFDAIRITKSARYTAAFTPKTEPFPN